MRQRNWDKGRSGGVVKEESLIELSLGIRADGFGGESHVSIKQEEGFHYLTSSQLYELYQQAIIFRFIVAGIPVPFPLVFGILRSVGVSLGVFLVDSTTNILFVSVSVCVLKLLHVLAYLFNHGFIFVDLFEKFLVLTGVFLIYLQCLCNVFEEYFNFVICRRKCYGGLV